MNHNKNKKVNKDIKDAELDNISGGTNTVTKESNSTCKIDYSGVSDGGSISIGGGVGNGTVTQTNN
ncbi:hypothetical protein [Francisella salimarina]|uniref:hypothetical protein n=1 Tax=Francisella salimarina TaxID=2599927 RepID=UPI0037511618